MSKHKSLLLKNLIRMYLDIQRSRLAKPIDGMGLYIVPVKNEVDGWKACSENRRWKDNS